jgi:FixJ family two-component response regulator
VRPGLDDFDVYIIDDDASVRSGLSRLMRSAGLEPHAFATPQEFFGQLPLAQDGCILLDVTMPEMSGLQVQEKLRAEGVRLPVIVLSATENEEVRQATHALGARFFLRKPVDAQALLDAITWVSRSQADPRPTSAPRSPR